MVEYKKHLSEPWFSLIKLGLKKCEGRLRKKDFAKMKKSDIIVFSNDDFSFSREFRCKITSIYNYNTFEEYLEKEKLEKCLPGIDSLEDGVNIYRKYYSKKDEDLYKIVAIRLQLLKN